MLINHDEDSIKNRFIMLGIGVVNRVDFTPINKKPGFTEKFDTVFKSAFIHFSDINVGFNYHTSFWEDLYQGKSYKIYISENEYWIILKNKNPTQNTMMNIHQVVENGRHLEKLIEEQSDKINKQEELINNLYNQLESVQGVVRELLCGLFNDSTQQQVLSENISKLYSENRIRSRFEEPDDSVWGNYPTTRQGDNCERRIEELERMVWQLNQNQIQDQEDQDTALYEIKHYKNYNFEEASKIVASLRKKDYNNLTLDEKMDIDSFLMEHDKYCEILDEAKADRACYMNGW